MIIHSLLCAKSATVISDICTRQFHILLRHDGATVSRADWRHLRTFFGRNRLGENRTFLSFLLLVYGATRRDS